MPDTVTTDLPRRRLLIGLAGMLLSGGPALAATLTATPAQTAGPFYPRRPPLDDDNDLTRVQGEDGPAKGRITDLTGRVLDLDGRPIRQARVEIWQCDAHGRYHHPDDNGPAPDPRFQGFGKNLTDTEGRYRFRTIRPVPYPGRTPHIHLAVWLPGARPFTTQLYVSGEPRNEADFIYMGIPATRRHLVVAAFRPARSGPAELAADFDIVLNSRDGTPRL